MKESNIQSDIIKRLKGMGCVVIKYEQNATTLKGFPDIMFMKGPFWGALEVKTSKKAHKQPGQQDWIDKLNEMSYAKFIYPENKEEILNEIKEFF